VELARLLLRHSAVELTHCFATREFHLSDEIFSEAATKVACLTDNHVMDHLTDIVFLATPAEVSAELAPKILAKGKTVIDLSGAFRLQNSEPWYGFDSGHKGEYGLVPFCGTYANETRLIANPGCYSTAINMALLPLLKHGVIESSGIVIDAKSGTSGAGRKASESLLYSEVEGQCLPYKVGRHQHLPEITEAAKAFADTTIEPHFATHLLPVKRGIIASIYANAKTSNLAHVEHAFATEYANYSLVRHGGDVEKLANLQKVVGTPYVHISYALNGKKLYVFSAIDNLLKGAASQAVENLNRVLDLPTAFSLVEEG
jgi:N-acetyl-gamma-glutamyl-phosphate reductase